MILPWRRLTCRSFSRSTACRFLRAIPHKVGKQFPVPPLLMEAMPSVSIFACAETKQRRRILQDAPDWSLKRQLDLREGFRGFLRRLDLRKVALACRLRVITLVEAEESPGRAFAWLQARAARLDNGTSRFMLKTDAGKICPEAECDLVRIPIGGTEKLQRIRREARRTIEAAVSDPGVPLVLGHVLAAHHHRPEARMCWHGMVDILGGVSLVIHDKAARPEAENPERGWRRKALRQRHYSQRPNATAKVLAKDGAKGSRDGEAPPFCLPR